jgi:hypothetical protein
MKQDKAHIAVKMWEMASNDVANYFVAKYFKGADYYWIGDDFGGVIETADRFFSMSDMVEFIRHKYSAKMLFSYYDEKLACDSKDKEWRYNIKNYKKLK